MKPPITLVAISILIALLWRLEVEIRGWDGLNWLDYFHLAIPIGGLLFLGWICLVARSSPLLSRIVGVAAAWGVAASFVLAFVASAYFVGGPSAISFSMMLGPVFDHIHWVAPFIWLASLLILYSGYRLIFRFPSSMWIIGALLWVCSWHIGLLAITALPERGHDDLIHSLKTGWMIPFCVIAAGLPVLYTSQKESEQSGGLNALTRASHL